MNTVGVNCTTEQVRAKLVTFLKVQVSRETGKLAALRW
jgi:hypothetical protein